MTFSALQRAKLTEPDELTFDNSYGSPTSSVMDRSPMYRVNRAKLAAEIADEFESDLPAAARVVAG